MIRIDDAGIGCMLGKSVVCIMNEDATIKTTIFFETNEELLKKTVVFFKTIYLRVKIF